MNLPILQKNSLKTKNKKKKVFRSKLQLPGSPGSEEPATIGRKLQFPEFRETRKRYGLRLRRWNRRACARAQLTRGARQLGRRT